MEAPAASRPTQFRRFFCLVTALAYFGTSTSVHANSGPRTETHQQPSQNAEPKVRDYFERGRSRYAKADYEGALVEFWTALEVAAPHAPPRVRHALLVNIATTHERLAEQSHRGEHLRRALGIYRQIVEEEDSKGPHLCPAYDLAREQLGVTDPGDSAPTTVPPPQRPLKSAHRGSSHEPDRVDKAAPPIGAAKVKGSAEVDQSPAVSDYLAGRHRLRRKAIGWSVAGGVAISAGTTVLAVGLHHARRVLDQAEFNLQGIERGDLPPSLKDEWMSVRDRKVARARWGYAVSGGISLALGLAFLFSGAIFAGRKQQLDKLLNTRVGLVVSAQGRSTLTWEAKF